MRPPAFVLLEVDVWSGERSTRIVPRSKLPSLPPGVQSRVRPFEFVEVQAPPRLAPRSQVPVPGVLGVPLAEHRGQGCVPLPVMNVWELSATFREAAPVERLSVPLPGALNVFSTYVLRVGEEGFGSGSGDRQHHHKWAANAEEDHPITSDAGP